MPNENEQPDWTLLPHNPKAFFSLSEDYDRKDLKRAYNKLLHRFKPEQHPAEFQKIRAAFERLDNALRYQLPSIDLNETLKLKPLGVEAKGDLEVVAETELIDSLTKRIHTDGPHPTADFLKTKTDKTPFDYFALAAISETGSESDGISFLNWCLAGLEQYRHDTGLRTLIYHWCRSEPDPGILPQALTAISEVIRTDHFYAITEPLWDQLLRTSPFDTFRESLKKCESNLMDYRESSRLAFYLHILRPALFRADDSWLNDCFEFLDEHARYMPPRLEHDLVVLDQLRTYQANRSLTVGKHPLCKRMDEVICTYSLEDEAHFESELVATQLQIVKEPKVVLKAFPASGEKELCLVRTWYFLSEDARERVDDSGEQLESVALIESATQLLREVNSTKSWLWYPALFAGIFLYTIGVFLFIFLATFITLGLVLGSTYLGFACIAAVVIGVLVAYFFGGKITETLVTPFMLLLARFDYRRRWRGRAANCVMRTPYSVRALGRGMDAAAKEQGTAGSYFADLFVNDYAMRVIESAKNLVG